VQSGVLVLALLDLVVGRHPEAQLQGLVLGGFGLWEEALETELEAESARGKTRLYWFKLEELYSSCTARLRETISFAGIGRRELTGCLLIHAIVYAEGGLA